MRKIIYSILISLTTLNGYSQTSENALSAVHYSFTFMRDSSDPSLTVKQNMVLFIGKDASAFTGLDRAIFEKSFKSNLKEFENYNGNIRLGITTVFYNFITDKRFIINDNQLKDYLIDDTINIKWNIRDSIKNIKGIECQKAIGKFRGRIYEVWFTNTIPFSSGPWKLGGLPGLILDVRDIKNEVTFSFTGIEQLTNNPYIIELPKDPIKLTKVEYKRLKEEIANDPMEYLNKMMPGVTLVPRGGVEPVNSTPMFTQVKPTTVNHSPTPRKPLNQMEIEDN
jgi:GLPGLI family protein